MSWCIYCEHQCLFLNYILGGGGEQRGRQDEAYQPGLLHLRQPLCWLSSYSLPEPLRKIQFPHYYMTQETPTPIMQKLRNPS